MNRSTRFLDPKAQRSAATAEAVVADAEANAIRVRAEAEAAAALAQADAIRADTDLRMQERRLDLAAQDRETKRTARAKERADKAAARVQEKVQSRKEWMLRWQRWRMRGHGLVAAVQARTPDLIGVVAVGAPMFIAWNGQLAFAEEMGLGAAAISLPISLEGGVLYTVYLTDQAIKKQLPTGRYRAMTWTLAVIAAAMNLWHQVDKHATQADPWAGLQMGVTFALTSLLTIVLLELKSRLTKQIIAKRSIDEIRQALWRRIRYPRLSWAAASLQAAQGCTVEVAWRRAWLDRFGVAPEAGRRDRKVGKKILKVQREADKDAALGGQLRIVNGTVIGRPVERHLVLDWRLPATPLAAVQGPTETIKVSVDRVDTPPVPVSGRARLALPARAERSRRVRVSSAVDGATNRRAPRISNATNDATHGRGADVGSATNDATNGSKSRAGKATNGATNDRAAERESRVGSAAGLETDGRLRAPRKSLNEHRTALQQAIADRRVSPEPKLSEIRDGINCGQAVAQVLLRELKGGSA
ncbi:DUF2637 domain-containing protein [Streptosporangium canum]|uniref:DUF2637 domain-containing protein n=1 Tax=Streptosporangium canum TaxID=324952 RepID=UPI00368B3184